MYAVKLLHISEGAAALERDLAALGIEVTAARLEDPDQAFAGRADAFVAEAPASPEETRRLAE